MITQRISHGRSLHAIYAEARGNASLLRVACSIAAGLRLPGHRPNLVLAVVFAAALATWAQGRVEPFAGKTRDQFMPSRMQIRELRIEPVD